MATARCSASSAASTTRSSASGAPSRSPTRSQRSWQNTDPEGNSAVARGTVTALDPPRLVEFDTDIHGRLRWELEPDGEGTALTFTADAHLPPDWELEVLAGWHIHLDHLEAVLDGGSIDWPNWGRDHMPEWERIRERYEARV
jgi:hypothetical protein